MKELKMALLTSKFTRVYHENDEDMKFGAPHSFTVTTVGQGQHPIQQIHFQEGPCKECGVNGVANEDLICMVIARLEGFQKTGYACRENELAITKLEEALLWLRKRTMDREQRSVDGTSQK